jgi:integrase
MIRLDLALLSRLFNTARTAWGMESLTNPVDLVKGQRSKLPGGRDRRLVGDELPRPLATAATYGGEIGSIITWAIETAMRRGEIAAMRWEHLDGPSGPQCRTPYAGGNEAPVLLMPETKNGTPRRVPLSVAALAVLDGLPRRIDGHDWVCVPTRSHRHLSASVRRLG